MERPTTAEEQEELFQTLILKLPGVKTPEHLEQVTLLAVDLMLRRPFDRDLRNGLQRRVREIVAGVNRDHPPDVMHNEMRAAARECIAVLRAAKDQRLPRAVTDNWAQSKDGKFHAHLHSAEDGGRRPAIILGGALVLLTAVVGGYIFWKSGQTPGENTAGESDRFIAQLVEATQGNPAQYHMFGGLLRITAMNGVPVVIAEEVPPRICSASGMKLVRKGLLSINGVTPTRVSSAIVTELCNKEGGGNAQLMWAPKQ